MNQANPKPTTLPEAVSYWRYCLSHLGQLSEEAVACDMVNIVSLSDAYFDVWYHRDMMFREAFDIAADLEIPGKPSDWHKRGWGRLKLLVARLERKYLPMIENHEKPKPQV